MVSTNDNGVLRRSPKYFTTRWYVGIVETPVRSIPYGKVDTALCVADVTAEQHALLASQPDVLSVLQSNLDNTIGAGVLALVQSTLESFNIPGQWVTTSNTYRQVLRVVAGLFQFAERYYVMYDRGLGNGNVNLSAEWQTLSEERQDEIVACAETFGYDLAWVQPTTLLRQVLKFLAEAWGTSVFHMGRYGDL